MSKYLEMATIRSKDKSKDVFYKIAIYGDEGNIPHCHFYRSIDELKRNLGGCIRLDSANYYPHGTHTSILNSQELKLLIAWFNLENKDIPNTTNFEACCIHWNANNPDFEKHFTSMPDYKKLNTVMETIKINKECKIPGTNLILEAGDHVIYNYSWLKQAGEVSNANGRYSIHIDTKDPKDNADNLDYNDFSQRVQNLWARGYRFRFQNLGTRWSASCEEVLNDLKNNSGSYEVWIIRK